MVYDTSHEPARNEIEFMLSNCQRCIDEADNTWAFLLRELAYVFIIMVFDKLKARAEGLTVTVSTPCLLASLPRSGNVCIEVCTVRHFRIDRSVFPSHGVGAVHRRCQLLRSGEDDPRILYAPPNSPRTCCIFPGILVLMDFVLLSGLLVYAFGSKITPPKNKEVVIGKVEVQGCFGSDCSMRCFPRRLMCSAASLTNPLRGCAEIS
jgi:hypothetical protein